MNVTSYKFLSNEMKVNFDVLCSPVKHRVFGQVTNTYIVTQYHYNVFQVNL